MTKSTTQSLKAVAQLGVIVVLAISVFAAWKILSPTKASETQRTSAAELSGYEPQESIDKLTDLGRAIQLYRVDYPPKPVKDRRKSADTGLPPNHFFARRT